jgi:AraC family transcriptional regulator
MLTAGETSLARIALDAGFVDQSHLTHVFRRVTGMTPGAMGNVLTGSAIDSTE